MPGPVNLERALPVDGWLARLGRGLWPPRCLVCGEAAGGRIDLCACCEAALPWMPPACLCCAMPLPVVRCAGPSRPAAAATVPAFTGPEDALAPASGRLCSACQHDPPALAEARAAFLYGFPLDRLLPRLKFHRDLAAGRLLATAMAAAFTRCGQPPSPMPALVPVPLHRARLRQRGYNQALELARPLARLLGLPLRTDLLRRSRATLAQSRLDASARAANLRDAFEVPLRARVPAHVVLIDDVMTTGATLNAAAEALLEAGADRIEAWTCARAP